ncbi:ATP-binding protein [Hymenobacter caeli]|uniref:histidine kinase n=1 Tax=Hymenobacter caeli TaxID=2735894 RepID=A0ABX2FX28_9BACT|nr:ATP-binding protein [Hymenobacter caeli]NRT21333.1 signal transduction histidine kinase [Hymenobacter caeli]
MLPLLLLLLSGPLAAQPSYRYWEANGDSLRRVLDTQHADTARLRTLRHLEDVRGYHSQADDNACLAELAQLALRLREPDARARRLDVSCQKLLLAKAPQTQLLDSLRALLVAYDRLRRPVPNLISELGRLIAQLQPPDSVYAFYQSRLAFYRKRGARENMAICYHGLGRYYVERGDYNQAISSYLRAADLYGTYNRYLQANDLKVAGRFYADWGNPAKALAYLRQSLDLSAALPRQRGGARMGYTYRGLAEAYRQLHDYPAALRNAVLSQAHDPTDTTHLGAFFLQLNRAYGLVLTGALWLDQGRPAEAEPLLARAQQLADSLKLPFTTPDGIFELDAAWARYYAARGEPARAETYWLTAYRKAREFKMMPQQLAYLHGMADFYAQQGQAALASNQARAALALSDSLEAQQGAFHVAQYEFERAEETQRARIGAFRARQQQDAARARRQRYVLGGVLVVLALLAGLGFVLWRSNRRQQRANTLLSQQKAEIQAQRDQTAQALTKLQVTQAQLIQAEKMASLGELTAGIAHEIQNPLNFVNNFSEVSAELMLELEEAQAAGDGEEVTALATDVRQNLTKISQHGQRAASIVRGMLEHSRTSTGERAPTNLNALTDEYLRLAYQGLRAKDKTFNAALHTDFAPGLPLVEAVAGDLGRVLLNLFGNAFYAVQQRQRAGEAAYAPTVRVATKRIGDRVEIRVSDNGTGMPPEVQAKVFQPFFTTKPTGEGTGLGLSLSHDIIVQGHGGTLTVESQPGRGSTFTILLPASRP